MPVLNNARWEAFAQNLAVGMTKAAAYRSAGFKASNSHSQHINARRLFKDHPEIGERIEELKICIEEVHAKRAQGVEKEIYGNVIDKQWVLAKLRENFERAMQLIPILNANGNPIGEFRYDGNVANRCLELIGKELGMFVDRKKITFTDSDKFAHAVSSAPGQFKSWLNNLTPQQKGVVLNSFDAGSDCGGSA